MPLVESGNRVPSAFERLSSWFIELGVQEPVAPVIIRTYSASLPRAKDTALQITSPRGINHTWLTTEMHILHDLAHYLGAVVIEPKGRGSRVGIAVPHESETGQPFLFLLAGRRDTPAVIPIREGVEVHPIETSSVRAAWLIGHPFVSQDVPQEHYLVLDARGLDASDFQKLIRPKLLVSGSAARRQQRVILGAQTLPFEYLLGLNQPGLHNLLGSDRPRR